MHVVVTSEVREMRKVTWIHGEGVVEKVCDIDAIDVVSVEVCSQRPALSHHQLLEGLPPYPKEG